MWGEGSSQQRATKDLLSGQNTDCGAERPEGVWRAQTQLAFQTCDTSVQGAGLIRGSRDSWGEREWVTELSLGKMEAQKAGGSAWQFRRLLMSVWTRLVVPEQSKRKECKRFLRWHHWGLATGCFCRKLVRGARDTLQTWSWATKNCGAIKRVEGDLKKTEHLERL